MNTPAHASCIALNGYGVLLRGPSGCGKSDLTLRLIDMGAQLVGDDYCLYQVCDGILFALPHPQIAGLLEIRGLGLVRFNYIPSAPVRLIVDLVPRTNVPRLPAIDQETLCGISLPRIHLHAFDASTPTKVRLAVSSLSGDIILVS